MFRLPASRSIEHYRSVLIGGAKPEIKCIEWQKLMQDRPSKILLLLWHSMKSSVCIVTDCKQNIRVVSESR